MDFTVIIGQTRHKTFGLAALEQFFRADPRPATADIEMALPILLEGKVRREEGQPEQVLLASGPLERAFSRNTTLYPEGELGVSCPPHGNDVPIRSINIHFRAVDDTLTDRGIVWIHPGPNPTLSLTLKPDRFGESNESIASVVEAAMAAAKAKVVDHFAH